MRYTLDIHFGVEAEKDAFVRRLSSVRATLSGDESVAAIDNFGLMAAMFDIVEGVVPPAPSAGNERQTTQSFMRNSGKCRTLVCVSCLELAGVYNGNESPKDESMFIAEEHCFSDLLEGLTSSCPCGMTRRAWMLESVVQVH